jgi:hypothetical protein
MSNILRGLKEGFADEFMKMAREKGYNVRQAGTIDQERERTQQMLAQRAKDREQQELQSSQEDFKILDQLKAEYEKLSKRYQALGGSNWQYADREQNLTDNEREARNIEPQLRALAARIAKAEKTQGSVAFESNNYTGSGAILKGLIESKNLDEDLRKWFKEKWVRFGPDGKIRGACARGDDSEGKPKCLPQSKAHSLGKKGRASAAARKRREDPNPERSGKAINVNTKKKSNEGVTEGFLDKFIKPKKVKPEMIMNIKKGNGELYVEVYMGEDSTYWIARFTFDMIGDTLKAQDISVTDEYRGRGIAKWVYDTLKNKGYTINRSPYQTDDGKHFWDKNKGANAKVWEQGVSEEQINELKCWSGYTRVQGVPAGAPGSCKKKTNEEHNEKCPHCGGPMFSEMLMMEKKDACYYKVKSRYKVWPSAYASGALVKCRKKGAKNWGTKSESVEEAANPAQQAAIAIAMKKAGKKPKRESAIMKGLVDETLGTPYPGTYEQETATIKRKGPERITAMTYESKKK